MGPEATCRHNCEPSPPDIPPPSPPSDYRTDDISVIGFAFAVVAICLVCFVLAAFYALYFGKGPNARVMVRSVPPNEQLFRASRASTMPPSSDARRPAMFSHFIRSQAAPVTSAGVLPAPTATAEDREQMDTREVERITAVRSLPVHRYSSVVCDDETKCVMCLESYRHGQSIRRLPCKHEFHRECIDMWLVFSMAYQQRACPLCKRDPCIEMILPTKVERLATTEPSAASSGRTQQIARQSPGSNPDHLLYTPRRQSWSSMRNLWSPGTPSPIAACNDQLRACDRTPTESGSTATSSSGDSPSPSPGAPTSPGSLSPPPRFASPQLLSPRASRIFGLATGFSVASHLPSRVNRILVTPTLSPVEQPQEHEVQVERPDAHERQPPSQGQGDV
jgi:hypothetical protein